MLTVSVLDNDSAVSNSPAQSSTNSKNHTERPSSAGGSGMKLLKGPVVMLRDCMDYSPTQRKFLTLCDNVMESAEDVDMVDLTAGLFCDVIIFLFR